MYRLSRERRSTARTNPTQRLLDDDCAFRADVNHAHAVARFCHLRENIDHLYWRDIVAASFTMRLREI